jgi:transglutaminase-like putative cysteine protease
MTARAGAAPLLSVFAWLAPVAASLAFVPLLDDNGYVLTAALLAAGPLAAALLLRLLAAPAGVVLLGQAVVVVAWTTWLEFAGTALGGVVPTGATLDALAGLLGSGVQTANAYAAPAPATDGLVFLVALSVLLCYLAVDALGVGLGRVPLTGLPLLALYTVPAALAPAGVPAMAFLPGGAAFLLLLGYDERERLAHWGRQISTITGSRSEQEQRRLNTGAMNASATRVGAVALGSAAILPLFIPVLPEGLFEGGPGGGDGGGEVQVTNPIVDLRRDLVQRSHDEAMLVRTRNGEVSYFRLAALDEFDGERWKFSDRDVDTKFDLSGGLTVAPGLSTKVATRTERFHVDVSTQFHSDWLPVPYAPTRVDVGGEWRYDPDTLDIVAGTEDEDAAGRTYRVDAVQALPTFDQLANAGSAPASVISRYTDVPDTVPDQVRQRAEQITAQGGSGFERAVLLQNWFRFEGGFRYSLQVPQGHSGGDILSFLNNKVGYCEQYAAAMALMARELDIPSRVAVGFLSASPVEDSLLLDRAGERTPPRTYRYTFADMHAWPELYFEGAGWVRFEPTPAARVGAQAPPWTTGDNPVPEPQVPSSVPSELPAGPQPTAPPGGLDPGNGAGGSAAADSTSPWWFAGAAVLLLALLTPAVTRVAMRRRRLSAAGGPVQRAEAVWAELRDAMRDLGYDWPVDTPRRAAGRLLPLVRRREAAESALRRLALTVERARFARVPGDATTLEHDLRLVVEALKARESRLDRVRAALVPRSLRGTYRRQNRLETQRFRNLSLDGDASALQAAP